ncbi:NUDIX domain-containing protein [Celeribacter litoreus]|uniref:NUDIX domain-containing protein n=1 Tax=Celeribacter litoreus TaxID=2876714 RepID=UPI001CCA654B|nr:NUDIX domain-containing protein [Celeribacter litoreus]MCA0043759.1 NUDIX domain-containing protein [Celeribacter litoreus]
MTDCFAQLSVDYAPDEVEFLRDALSGDEPYLSPDLISAASEEALLYRGKRSVQEVRALRPAIFIRAWARVTARAGGRPRAEGRADLKREDVTLLSRELPYSAFFALEDTVLKHRQFDGAESREMHRAGFLMADAVTVLPYDPVRDRVLLIEQFRVGAFSRGDVRPWMLEPIAGRVDPGEGTEATARREAVEEAEITLGILHKIAEYYPSSGAVTEYVTSYIGIADLPDSCVSTGGGVDHEHEDIASTLWSFDQLMEMCDAGQLDVGPLYMSALWLDRHRDRIRADYL